MGITFGDDAKVKVQGDMVGGDKVTINEGVWNAAAAVIASQADISPAAREEATRSLSALRAEAAKDEPNPTLLDLFGRSLKQLAPQAFKVLVAAAPEIVKLIPALVS